jgi:hypothetical protein
VSALTNVFEDASTIREGGWMRAVHNFERIPDDYGVAWYLPDRAVAVCVPIPFHTLFGWAYRIYWHWRVSAGATDVLSQMYERGRRNAEAAAQRSIAIIRAAHDRELLQAYQRGRVDMCTELQTDITAFFGGDKEIRH